MKKTTLFLAAIIILFLVVARDSHLAQTDVEQSGLVHNELLQTTGFTGKDFAYERTALNVMFPNQDSVMRALTIEKEAILNGEQKSGGKPNGNFETGKDNTEIGNADWGAVALLAYWYHKSGLTDERVGAAANRGLEYAAANRDWTDDS